VLKKPLIDDPTGLTPPTLVVVHELSQDDQIANLVQ
jgi:hypothetical protein